MADSSRRQGGKKRRPGSKKKNGGNKIIRNVIIGVEAVVLIAVIVILIFVFRATGDETGVQKYDLDPDKIVINVDEDDPVVQETRKGYTTLALFGVDARAKKAASTYNGELAEPDDNQDQMDDMNGSKFGDLADYNIGDTVKLTIFRNNKEKTLDIRLSKKQ